jgi:hypothetical protein
MGNWTSKEEIIKQLDQFKLDSVPVFEINPPLESASEILNKNGELTVIGFDTLQVPKYKITFKLLK